ncbi:MAG: WD40 repeat domain-containing protein [Planctomycetota bacterium]|nr:MAG: WD40 repeat domain-containing protein [Planctomycetota bacterium]
MTIEDPQANCIAWHPDGTQIATGGRDGCVRVWDTTTGKLRFELAGHSGYIFRVAWSPNGDRIASASHDQTVRIWDSVTRENCAPVQQIGAAVNSLCWSPDGREIAAKAGASVVISNVETGLPVKTFEVLDRESDISWHPSQPQLATCQTVIDMTSGTQRWSHPGHRMQWSPVSNRIAVAADRSAFILSGEDGKVLFELAGHSGAIHQIAWSPSGTEVATASHDDTLRVWDTLTGRLLTTLRGHTDWVLGVAWSPDGKQLASVSKSAIKLWSWPHRPNPARLTLERTAIAEVAWSPDGSTLAAGHSRFVFWAVDTLERKAVVELGLGGLDTTFTPSVSWNSAAHLFAARRNDASVLFDDQTGEARFEIPIVDTRFRSLALSPDGTRLATSAYQEPTATEGDCGMLRVYDTATGKPVWEARHHGDTAGSLAWSPDGSRIAIGGWTVLAVVDASNGELIAKNSADYSVGWTHGIAWSPTGDRVALAHFNHTVRIIDTKQGLELKVLVGHTGDVRAVSWSPDGSRIASGGHDQTVRIWDSQSGLQMLVLPGHKVHVASVRWSPDGQALASGGGDGEVRIWDARIDPLRQLIATPNSDSEPPPPTGGPARPEDLPLSPADIERELARMASEIEAGPNSIAWLNNRGVFLARLGRWRESADDYLQVAQSMPTRRFHWGIAATPLLMAGEQDRYREHCLTMVEQFRGTTEADVADTVCKTALLVPDVVKLTDLPIDVLRAGANDPKWAHYRSWFIACCALISYREGQPEAAIDWTRKLSEFDSQPGTLALCVRAMAEFQLGQHVAARQSLKEAEQQIPLRLRTLGTPDDTGPLPVPLGITDHDWLVTEILRREAAALLK